MTVTLDRGLELLLKYRPALYAQGRLAFDVPRPTGWVLSLVGTLLVAAVVWAYRGGALGLRGRGARPRARRAGRRAAGRPGGGERRRRWRADGARRCVTCAARARHTRIHRRRGQRGDDARRGGATHRRASSLAQRIHGRRGRR